MRLLFSLSLGLLSLGVMYSQDPLEKRWSLEQCVQYALENNLQVQSTAMQAEVSKNNLQSAQWNYAPSINGFGNAGWNFGFNIDPVSNIPSSANRFTASMGISGNWVLFDGTRKYNTIAQSNHNYLASLYDLEDIKNDITLNVASAYLQILLNREILAVAMEQEKISKLQVERTTKLVEAGSAPLGDQLELESQLARDEQNTVAAENALLISKIQLANLLQLSDPENFSIDNPEIEIPEAGVLVYKPAQVLETALDNQPSIKAAEERIISSAEGIDVSRGGYYPTLSLQGQVATNYSDQIREATEVTEYVTPVPYYDQNGVVRFQASQQYAITGLDQKAFGDQVGDNLNEYIGFNLSVPIFNRLQVKNNVQSSKLQYQISQLQLQQEQNALKQTIYQAHADAKASFNSYRAAEKAVQSSSESFKYAQERYELGAINQYDFENAKNNMAVAQSQMIRAKYDYIFKIKVLEFYLTNQIKL